MEREEGFNTKLADSPDEYEAEAGCVPLLHPEVRTRAARAPRSAAPRPPSPGLAEGGGLHGGAGEAGRRAGPERRCKRSGRTAGRVQGAGPAVPGRRAGGQPAPSPAARGRDCVWPAGPSPVPHLASGRGSAPGVDFLSLPSGSGAVGPPCRSPWGVRVRSGVLPVSAGGAPRAPRIGCPCVNVCP